MAPVPVTKRHCVSLGLGPHTCSVYMFRTEILSQANDAHGGSIHSQVWPLTWAEKHAFCFLVGLGLQHNGSMEWYRSEQGSAGASEELAHLHREDQLLSTVVWVLCGLL